MKTKWMTFKEIEARLGDDWLARLRFFPWFIPGGRQWAFCILKTEYLNLSFRERMGAMSKRCLAKRKKETR